MMHDDYVVIAEEVMEGTIDVEANVPSPAPAPVPEGSRPDRMWTDFVNDRTPIKTYEVNGIHYYIKNGIPSEVIRGMVKGHGGCITCMNRSKKLCSLIGPVPKGSCDNGSVFLRNIRGYTDGGCMDGCLYNICRKVNEMNEVICNPKVFVVGENTFPSVKEGTNLKGEEYEHFTVFPDAFTSQEKINNYERLISKYMDMIQIRLEKLCEPKATKCVDMIYSRMSELLRPGHWEDVMKWIMDLQRKAQSKKVSFMRLNKKQKVHISVYAITTGRSEIDGETIVHKDFHKSSNIVDFITMTSMDDVLREMDKRSNPDNYMVSQLNNRLTKECITSKYTISLSWDEEYKDDLDLHVKPIDPNYPEISYQNKKVVTSNGDVYSLDFDANVNKGEAFPCENISVGPGRYSIMVNNYTRRSFGKDIPFVVIFRENGTTSKVIECHWDKNRGNREKMYICDYTFIENKKEDTIGMSTKASNRAVVLNSKWMDHMGNPTSMIATLESMDVPYTTWEYGKPSCSQPLSQDVNARFMGMAGTSKKAKTKNGRKKYLCEYEEQKCPSTLNELLIILSKGKHSVKICPRDYTPGYITSIRTNKKVTKSDFMNCHYKDKFSIPVDPSYCLSENNYRGNARFNSNWFKKKIMDDEVEVEAFIYVRSVWFLVVKGTCIPMEDSDFPLCGGFRPTDLTANFYDLRDRWSYCNTIVKPEMNRSGISMIGSFITEKKMNLIVDGKKMTVDIE